MEPKRHSFEMVKAWREARKFRKNIYELSKKFPREELFCLTAQIRRAAISIHSNIAEGYGRYNFQENLQFCRTARGSLNETLDQLYVALDEEYVSQDEFRQTYKKGQSLEYDINCYIKFLKEQKSNYN